MFGSEKCVCTIFEVVIIELYFIGQTLTPTAQAALSSLAQAHGGVAPQHTAPPTGYQQTSTTTVTGNKGTNIIVSTLRCSF